MFAKLDAEFAMIIYDAKADRLVAARDPIGIRPLFYGYLADGGILFASEAKNLVGLCERIMPFPPGHYYADGKFVRYADLTTVTEYSRDDLDTVCKKIREKLIAGVEKRLDADAPLGFLLSGGLDSSLVCAISAKLLGKRIRTFAIGMDLDPIDLKYAREVADFIGAEHTEVIMTREQVLASLEEVVAMLGTYDITTIRASMGMYLCCKAIHEQTDVRVLMTGEISDELFGYKYTDFAPSPEAFQQEAKKRVDELYMYDVLRADRCIAVNSIEARVPFGDLDFVKYVMSIDPKLKVNSYHMGKYLLREAFAADRILPEDILWRQKAPSPTPSVTRWWTISRNTPKACTPTRSTRKSGSSIPLRRRSRRKACSTASCSRSITPGRPRWSRTSGCRTRTGRAATSRTPPPACSPTTAQAACELYGINRKRPPRGGLFSFERKAARRIDIPPRRAYNQVLFFPERGHL